MSRLLLARLVDGAAHGGPGAGAVPRLVRVPLLLLLGARRRRGGESPGGAEAERPEHVEVVPRQQSRRRLGGLVVVLVVVDVGRVEEVVGVDHVEEIDGVVGEERGDVEVVGVCGVGESGLVELVLAEPVVPEPGGGIDELPPLGREVLHLPVRRRDEERRVRVQRRRRHGGGGHGAHPGWNTADRPSQVELFSAVGSVRSGTGKVRRRHGSETERARVAAVACLTFSSPGVCFASLGTCGRTRRGKEISRADRGFWAETGVISGGCRARVRCGVPCRGGCL